MLSVVRFAFLCIDYRNRIYLVVAGVVCYLLRLVEEERKEEEEKRAAALRAEAVARGGWACALRVCVTRAWAMLMLELRILFVRLSSAATQLLASERARRETARRRQQRLDAHEKHLQTLIE